ncbi:MAG TPA: anti-sigma factor [Actinomycetota bacterium]|nr:anti-sigma factor [Actinomycetota bacterium]
MTRDHTVIEELLAVDALGGLDGGDRGLLELERASHGTGCPDCTALEAGFAEIAGRLAFALDPEPVDDAIADRILGGGGASATTETIVEIPDELEEHRARRPRVWQALVAAAAVVAIALVAVGAIVPSTTSVRATTSQRLVAFTGDTEGSLAMAFTPGEPGAVFWGSDLPEPGADRVYEIWMIEGDEAVSGGCVSPTDGVVAVRVEASVGTTDTMAVTTEPSDCPSTPSGDPVLVADLTTVV